LDEPEVLEFVSADLCQIMEIDDRELVQDNIELLKASLLSNVEVNRS